MFGENLDMSLVVILSLLSTFAISTAAPCKDGDLRLIGSFLEGRVEICSIMGEWGTVCDDLWDNQDATVVCRELGFSDQGAMALNGDYISSNIGSGTGEILLRKVACSGNETRLRNCSQQSPIYCSHSEDAGVRCRYNDYSTKLNQDKIVIGWIQLKRIREPALVFNRVVHPNNSIIELESMNTIDGFMDVLTCVTNQYPCCSITEETSWYLPNNTAVTLYSNFVQSAKFSQLLGLYRNGEKFTPNGLFYCQTEDSSEITYRLYIGIYLEGLGIPTITSFKLDRPSWTLICSSINGPVTAISWRKDGKLLYGSVYQKSQLILDTGSAVYENNLTIIQSDVEVSGLYSCTVSNSRGNSSAELSVPACNNGDALFKPDTGEISQICHNGHYHDVVVSASQKNQANENIQNDGQGSSDTTVIILVVLIVLLMLVVIAIALSFGLFLIRTKQCAQPGQYDVPSDRPYLAHLDNAERIVVNEMYGDSDSSSMQYNLAYTASATLEEKPTTTNENLYEVCNTSLDQNNVEYEFPSSNDM